MKAFDILIEASRVNSFKEKYGYISKGLIKSLLVDFKVTDVDRIMVTAKYLRCGELTPAQEKLIGVYSDVDISFI